MSDIEKKVKIINHAMSWLSGVICGWAGAEIYNHAVAHTNASILLLIICVTIILEPLITGNIEKLVRGK